MNFKKVMRSGVPTLVLESEKDVHGFLLLDVRRPEEYSGELGHIENSQLVTLGDDLIQFLNAADKEKPILFICRSGARSANATMYALDLGFKEVYNMEGGMIHWNELNFPVKF
jgi:rhodanese-related sulfurtransferase